MLRTLLSGGRARTVGVKSRGRTPLAGRDASTLLDPPASCQQPEIIFWGSRLEQSIPKKGEASAEKERISGLFHGTEKLHQQQKSQGGHRHRMSETMGTFSSDLRAILRAMAMTYRAWLTAFQNRGSTEVAWRTLPIAQPQPFPPLLDGCPLCHAFPHDLSKNSQL